MRHLFALTSTATALGLLLAAPQALATNGYFQHGYGVKSQGMAGVGIALPQDALAAASNPAGQAFVGNRVDVGLTLFTPSRGAEVEGNPAISGSYSGNGKKHFFMPDGGYVKQVNDELALGVAVYGNGGMNTHYKTNPFGNFGGQGPLKMNLEQLFITPALAWKITPEQALGVGLNLAYQRFSASGLEPFAGMSSDAANVTGRGTDSSSGAGIRLGWTGQVTPELTLGATWASKTRMGRFKKYQGLFAEGGDFDIPANYGLGLAWQANEAWTVAADVQRIQYSGVKSVGNPNNGQALGSANGAGFGWRDVTATKLGVSYAASPELTLRAGYSHSSQPIRSSETFFNIIAPGVVQDHISLGATWKLGEGELSAAYTHALKKTVKGQASIPPHMGGGEANVRLKEDILGISWGRSF